MVDGNEVGHSLKNLNKFEQFNYGKIIFRLRGIITMGTHQDAQEVSCEIQGDEYGQQDLLVRDQLQSKDQL